MHEAPGPKTRGQPLTCARGELNRRTTTLDHARTAVLSVKPRSRCLRFAPVTSGACAPGVHQPAFFSYVSIKCSIPTLCACASCSWGIGQMRPAQHRAKVRLVHFLRDGRPT